MRFSAEDKNVILEDLANLIYIIPVLIICATEVSTRIIECKTPFIVSITKPVTKDEEASIGLTKVILVCKKKF